MQAERVIAVRNRDRGIAAIVRRLDRLLEEMADVPAIGPAGVAANQVMIKAARGERRARRERERLFGATLPSEPSWDMLIELFIAGEEGKELSLQALSGEASVGGSVALRCIAHLAEARLVTRRSRCSEDREALLALTEQGRSAMCAYFSRNMAADEGGAGA